MDELEIIRALRPEPTGPTDTERATAKERLMQTITDVENDTPRAEPSATDPGAEPGPDRQAHRFDRWRRRWPAAAAAAVAVAATVAIVLGALTVFGSSGPLSPAPAAAAELHRLADLAGQSQYPPEPYSIVTRYDTGSTDPTTSDAEPPTSFQVTTYTLGQGNSVTDTAGCDGGAQSPLGSAGPRPPAESVEVPSAAGQASDPGAAATDGTLPPADARIPRSPLDQCGLALIAPIDDPELANAATPLEAHAVLDRQVQATVDARPGTSQTAATLQVIARALHTPTGTPAARAELLRVVADSTSITVEPNVRTPLGATGSRFSADAAWGTFQVVVDPTDGYLLETHTVDRQIQPIAEDVTSFGRPQGGELPERIKVARDALVANTPAMESDPAWQHFPPGNELCDVSTRLQADHVTPVPAGLGLTHCWTTPS